MRTLTAILLMMLATTALAQDVPTITDEPGVPNLPAEASFDILGIQLGMTPSEVEAATSKRMRTNQGRLFFTDPQTGGEFQLEYPAEMNSVSPPLIGNERFTAGQDEVTVELGTQAVGGRVMSVRRFLSPPDAEPISMEGFRQLLTDKYGEPSGANKVRDALIWIYDEDGNKLDLPFFSEEVDYRGLMDPVSAGTTNEEDLAPAPCVFALRSGVSDGLYPYEYQEERELRDPDCVAALFVKLRGGDRLQNATLVMVDGQRRIANAQGLDQAIEEAFSGGAPSRNAPEL